MSTGKRVLRFSGIVVLSLASASYAAQTQHHHKTKKKDPLPPLPSGPTGRPIQQIPLDSMPPVAPQVTYTNGQLTIVAANSTLSDILRAVKKQTGADIDVPDARERVVTHLGPGPAQEIISELLNGSRFNYVLLGAPQNPKALTRVVLVARAPETNRPNQSIAALNQPQPPQPDQPQPDMGADTGDADASVPEENSVDETAEQPVADPDQSAQPDQPQAPPGVKTPQELLQEMQQRQLQMQQQQNPGQPPPAPPPGVVQRPQQEQ